MLNKNMKNYFIKAGLSLEFSMMLASIDQCDLFTVKFVIIVRTFKSNIMSSWRDQPHEILTNV